MVEMGPEPREASDAETDDRASAPTPVGLARRLLGNLLALHVAVVVAFYVAMPGGFPFGHPKMLSNQLVPPFLALAGVVGVWSAWRHRPAVLAPLGVTIPAGWLAMGVAGWITFPVSFARVALGSFAVASLSAGIFAVYWRREGFRAPAAVAGGVLLGALAGVGAPLAQRGVDPGTRPLEAALPARPAGESDLAAIVDPHAELGLGRVSARHGEVAVAFGAVRVTIDPLVHFISRSPDRCWTSLAPRATRVSAPRRLTDVVDTGDRLHLRYESDDGGQVLEVGATADGVEVDAWSELRGEVYSHLNRFSFIEVSGHRDLAVSFSPCPDRTITITSSDYPYGRPSRLAYLGADGVFRVVEARSAEKGPFTTLAEGPLRPDEPLTIVLHDAGDPVGRIVLEDWAAQVGTGLSPTAGWGLPENAIELFRVGESCQIFITLAGTSVGRGWDSVGHAPGVYRNRLRFQAAGR